MALFDWLFHLPGDAGIYQTVAKIKSAIYFSLRDPLQRIRKRAESVIRSQGLPERNEAAETSALAQFVKDRFHFVHDPRGLEYTKSPEFIDDEISRYGKFIGDCDDAAGYLAALLKAVGYQVRFCVVSAPKNPAQNFTHIFTQVYLTKPQRWASLDMTAKGKPLGWTAPHARVNTFSV